MALSGELISLLVASLQEVGIVVAVGAQTIILVAHLLALHSRRSEDIHAYVRAAKQVRAVALMLIILSGVAAIIIHVQTGTPGTLLAPAFLFKWALIVFATALHFKERKVVGWRQDSVEGFEGANWYALFIVHTMAPVVSWLFLIEIYAGWLAAFGVVWAAFVWFMRWQGRRGVIEGADAGVSTARRSVEGKDGAGGAPASAPVVATVTPKVEEKKIEVMPNHSLLPMIAELDLPAPAPVPKVVPPAPIVVPPKPEIPMPNLEEPGLPGIRVMPKRPEDIEASNRSPLVKFDSDDTPGSAAGASESR